MIVPSFQPVSYYATHTHVEPIKDILGQQEAIDEVKNFRFFVHDATGK